MNVFLVTVCSIVAAHPSPGAEDKKFLGTWEVIAAEDDGKPADDWLRFRVTFQGKGHDPWNEGEVNGPDGENGRAVWWLDPAKSPKQIKLGFSLLIRSGIYEIHGDRLTMCFSRRNKEGPPGRFGGPKEPGALLWKLRKVK